MPEEMTTALQEIAILLRRRVEQQDEMAQRSQELVAKHERQRSTQETIEQIHAKGEQHSAEIVAKMERKAEQAKQEKDDLQQEQRQFQQRLLTELERHNSLIERLLSRLI